IVYLLVFETARCVMLRSSSPSTALRINSAKGVSKQTSEPPQPNNQHSLLLQILLENRCRFHAIIFCFLCSGYGLFHHHSMMPMHIEELAIAAFSILYGFRNARDCCSACSR